MTNYNEVITEIKNQTNKLCTYNPTSKKMEWKTITREERNEIKTKLRTMTDGQNYTHVDRRTINDMFITLIASIPTLHPNGNVGKSLNCGYLVAPYAPETKTTKVA